MKKLLLTLSFLFLIHLQGSYSQTTSKTEVYLLTCGPGTDTYSIYGHSAIRIIMPDKNSDIVFNWGVFDFNTPNFTWKFAKGRLDYMLGTMSINGFLSGYKYEKRFVFSQKINLTEDEIERLIILVNENLKPENLRYRYDFFYDDCSTRIRDLLEKSIGKSLLYPPEENERIPTFRELVGKYQNPYPWLNLGIDLIMGSPSDKEALCRDRMFLPIDMQNELVDTRINRSGKMIPLLQNPEIILDFETPDHKLNFFLSPTFIFTLLLIIIIIISGLFKNSKIINLIDVLIYSTYSILALLMIFFNFFTDHQQMKWNLNIIWLNPIIIIGLILLILKKSGIVWFRLIFYVSTLFFVIQIVLPQDFNSAIIPLVVILIFRSSARSDFDWNPYSINNE
jgi:uncharacterized protein DUF4105